MEAKNSCNLIIFQATFIFTDYVLIQQAITL